MTTLAQAPLRLLAAALQRLSSLQGPRARLAVMAVVALFYALTAAGNLAEPDDALAFAWRAEHVAVAHASDPRLLGYHALARALWLAAQRTGLPADGLQVLRALSLLAAVAGLWGVWRLLVRRLGVDRPAALLATAALACSYGWWRYAVEGDVYVLAMALCTGVLYAVMSPRLGVVRSALLGAAAGVAVVVYQPDAIPLFLALPWLVWHRHGLVAAAAYVLAGCAAAAAGYGLAYAAYWPDPLSVDGMRGFLAQRSDEFDVLPLSARNLVVSLVRAVLAAGHDLVSANWAFGVAPLRALALRSFGGNALDEEIFLARAAGAWVWLPLLLLPLLALALHRCWRAAAMPWRQRLASLRTGAWPVLGLWLLLTALVILRLNPGGIEAWLVALLPLHLLLAPLLWGPACARVGAGLPALCVLLLGLHNAVGGMALVQSPAADLVRLRGDWLVQHAVPGDLIVVTGDLPLTDALRWRSRADVMMVHPRDSLRLALALYLGVPPSRPVLSAGRDLAGADLGAACRATLARGGRLWVQDRFFTAPPGTDETLVRGLDAMRQRSPLVQRLPGGDAIHQVLPAARGPAP